MSRQSSYFGKRTFFPAVFLTVILSLYLICTAYAQDNSVIDYEDELGKILNDLQVLKDELATTKQAYQRLKEEFIMKELGLHRRLEVLMDPL